MNPNPNRPPPQTFVPGRPPQAGFPGMVPPPMMGQQPPIPMGSGFPPMMPPPQGGLPPQMMMPPGNAFPPQMGQMGRPPVVQQQQPLQAGGVPPPQGFPPQGFLPQVINRPNQMQPPQQFQPVQQQPIPQQQPIQPVQQFQPVQQQQPIQPVQQQQQPVTTTTESSHRRRLYPEEISTAYQPSAARPVPAPAAPLPGYPTATPPSYPNPNLQNVQNQFANMSMGSPQMQPQQAQHGIAVNLIGTPLNLQEVDWTPSPFVQPELRLSTSPYANALPVYKSSSLSAFPNTQALADKSGIPLGLVLQPIHPKGIHEDKVPVITPSTIVRCRKCRSYINPFVAFVENGTKWKCNMCFAVNDIPSDFDYDPHTQQRIGREQRPEIHNGVIEFVAPAEYMVRPPQPPIYLFIIDVSYNSIVSGMLGTAVRTIKESLDNIPNKDGRVKIGLITVDSALHFYYLDPSLSQPQMMVVSDLEEVFLPRPDELVVNLIDSRSQIDSLLDKLPEMFRTTQNVNNCLGSALQAAQQMIGNIGGKIIILQSTLPNCGVGALNKREDPPSMGTAKETALLQPSNPFYKNFAVDCSRFQIGVDLFLFASQYVDIASLETLPHYTGGSLFYYPAFNAGRAEDANKLGYELSRHLGHVFGMEAVMRIRASKGIRMTVFHGNFFVRSTDLLSMPNVNPDNAYAVQMSIDETISYPVACFQTALLYTSILGDRRIRVVTLAVPVASDLQAIMRSVNTPTLINLLSKMAVERSLTSKIEDARDALRNKVTEIITTFKSSVVTNAMSGHLLLPENLKCFPLMTLSLIKHDSFKSGSKIQLDARSYALALLRSLPLTLSNALIVPRFYALHLMSEQCGLPNEQGQIQMPPIIEPTSEKLDRAGFFLLDNGQELFLWIGPNSSNSIVQQVFGVPNYSSLPSGKFTLKQLENAYSTRIQNIIGKITESRATKPFTYLVKDDGDNLTKYLFFTNLVMDRSENMESYQQFLHSLREKSASS